MSITITMAHGGQFVSDEDRLRAIAAAQSVLANAGADPTAAFDAYGQMIDRDGPLTDLARIWQAAQQAADVALTQGWHDTEGAFCEIGLAATGARRQGRDSPA